MGINRRDNIGRWVRLRNEHVYIYTVHVHAYILHSTTEYDVSETCTRTSTESLMYYAHSIIICTQLVYCNFISIFV